MAAGVIVAWGDTDIDSPSSALHGRDEIGVPEHGAHRSVDTGKRTGASDRSPPAPPTVIAVPTAREAHERVGGHAAARQSVLARSVIAAYTRPTQLEFLSCVPGLRFRNQFAPGRLFDVPVTLGWLAAFRPECALLPFPDGLL